MVNFIQIGLLLRPWGGGHQCQALFAHTLYVAIPLVASATDTDESWPTQARRLPSPLKLTE